MSSRGSHVRIADSVVTKWILQTAAKMGSCDLKVAPNIYDPSKPYRGMIGCIILALIFLAGLSMMPAPEPDADQQSMLAVKQTAPYPSSSRTVATPIEADDKTEQPKTHTLVMKVAGHSEELKWTLQLPPPLTVRGRGLLGGKSKTFVDVTVDKSGRVKFGKPRERRGSTLWVDGLRWRDIAQDPVMQSKFSKEHKDFKVHVRLTSHYSGRSFSQVREAPIRRNCSFGQNSSTGLVALHNIPEKKRYSPWTGLPSVYGSCFVRTDGSTKRFVHVNVDGKLGSEVECFLNVEPGVCNVHTDHHGWSLKYEFPVTYLEYYNELRESVDIFLNKHTFEFGNVETMEVQY